jgi:TetR/AcrR family transcriptional regulator, ethionamide resistance regulator
MPAPRRARRPDGEVRAALLTAAEHLLHRSAIADLTVGDLLREAGVSRASFYFYFASKHDVVIALAEEVIGKVEEAAAPWLKRSDLTPAEALRAATRGSLEVWERHGPVLRAVAESWHSSPELGDLWGGFVSRFVAAARDQVAREREEGLAPPRGPDPAALAAALIWMNERVFYLHASASEPALADGDTVVDVLVAIWLGAVYAEPAPT